MTGPCYPFSDKIQHLRAAVTFCLSLGGSVLLFSCASPNSPGKGLRSSGAVYEGNASWYSVATNGGTATASGEKLSNHGKTAAHKTLPMGTMVKVTNLLNDKSEILRINDRGPFVGGRIIDIPIGAAERMDFVNRGVAPVRVEVLERSAGGAAGR